MPQTSTLKVDMSSQIMTHYTNAAALACAENALHETDALDSPVSLDGDHESHYHMNDLHQYRLDNDGSRYAQCLAQMNERVGAVPFGWQGLYCDLRVGLKAISSPLREMIKIDGPFVHNGSIGFDTGTNDRAVNGLLRKAERRSRCTCMECGRPGQGREVGDMSKTLCGSCAGLQLLERELRQLLYSLNTSSGLMNAERVFAHDLSPRVRILIDPNDWISEQAGSEAGCRTFVKRTTLLAMKPHFSLLLERLCSINE